MESALLAANSPATHSDAIERTNRHDELTARLPFDVWLAVSQHLSIKDLESLRASSRLLRAFLDERTIWHAALLDVLSVKPLPHLRADVLHMSTEELRRACVRAATVEQAFAHGELAPRPVAATKGDFVQACLLPGGTRYITVTARGSLELRHVGGMSALAGTPAPEQPPSRTDIRVLPKSLRDVLVLQTLHWNSVPDYDGVTDVEFRVYALCGDAAFTLLRTCRPKDARNIVHYGIYPTDGGVTLLYLRGRYEREYVVELRFLSENGPDKTLRARLRGWIMCSYMQDFLPLFGSVSLVSSNRLLLAASEGIYLYDFPSVSNSACDSESLIDLKPIWTTYSRWLTRTPIMSPPVISDDPQPRARCMLWTGKDIFDLDFPLGPVTDDSRFMLHVIHTQYNHAPIHLGYSMGIQHPECAKKVPTLAFSLAFGWGCEGGHVRLGRAGPCVRKARLAKEHVTLAGDDSVGDLSVDEWSGRLSVLDLSTGHLQIYDIV